MGFTAFLLRQRRFLPRKAVNRTLPSQSADISVYERQGGQERWAYISPAHFDSRRLTTHFKDGADLSPFDLDLKFDPAAQRWTGLWSLCGKTEDVILDRPRPREGVAPNPLVGDWDGYSAPTASFRSAPGTLHIRQGYDGGLTAWLDRTFSRYDPRLQLAGIDQRNGEHLRVLSATQGAIVLATVNSIGVSYQYEGMLSGDGKSIVGEWRSVGGMGGTLNAPTRYRLVD